MLENLTVEKLAALIGMEPDAFLNFSDRAPCMYRTWSTAKRVGLGVRIIEAPEKSLKAVQKIVLDKILSKLRVHRILFGGKGSMTKMAVRNHTRKPMVITLDISDFFPSVKRAMVRKTLRERGASEEIARTMTRLMTYENHLAQGAPTSSRMAMLVLHNVMIDVEKALKTIGYKSVATIWVDDITLSGPKGLTRVIPTIVKIFKRHGFGIHRDKLRIMPQSIEQNSLNIKINDGLAVSSGYLKKYHTEGQPLPPGNPKRRGMESYMRDISRG